MVVRVGDAAVRRDDQRPGVPRSTTPARPGGPSRGSTTPPRARSRWPGWSPTSPSTGPTRRSARSTSPSAAWATSATCGGSTAPRWAARSGTAGSGTELLDVEHNAIQFDRVTNRVYVGADIGVWESADGGANWTPLQNGLPDAPVFDLQIHPTARLLRASLHGARRLRVEARRARRPRRRALRPRHDARHRPRREHGRADRSVGPPDRPGRPLPEPEHQDRRADAGRLPDADDRHRLPHLQRGDRRRQQRRRHERAAADRSQPRVRRGPQPRPLRRHRTCR